MTEKKDSWEGVPDEEVEAAVRANITDGLEVDFQESCLARCDLCRHRFGQLFWACFGMSLCALTISLIALFA